jgi:hypothetical protein
MMPYHMTDNFRAWLADLTDAEVAEFAAKLEMPLLLDLTDRQFGHRPSSAPGQSGL